MPILEDTISTQSRKISHKIAITVARITSAHGLKGECKVSIDSLLLQRQGGAARASQSEDFATDLIFATELWDNHGRRYRLKCQGHHQATDRRYDGRIVAIEGVQSREEAEALAGTELHVWRESLLGFSSDTSFSTKTITHPGRTDPGPEHRSTEVESIASASATTEWLPLPAEMTYGALLGMRVEKKDQGEVVGYVADIVNFGAGTLLIINSDVDEALPATVQGVAVFPRRGKAKKSGVGATSGSGSATPTSTSSLSKSDKSHSHLSYFYPMAAAPLWLHRSEEAILVDGNWLSS